MKKEIVGEKNVTVLEKRLETEREKLRSFRFRISQGKVRNVKEGAYLKRTIARILTQMNRLS